MDTLKVHFSQTDTVRGKPVLPHHAEQIEFMSSHMIVPLIFPVAELLHFPNTVNRTATNAIRNVLQSKLGFGAVLLPVRTALWS